jgi:hypothetical protein
MARMLTIQFQDELNAVDPNRILDTGPARRPRPSPAYNRPGVEDLIPDDAESPTSAAKPAGPPPDSTEGTQGNPQP